MKDRVSETFREKVRLQYNTAPYPTRPIEDSPESNIGTLMLHSLATPYYLTYQKFTDTQGKVILDAGCGSGYNALTLAKANPGAKIVGVDFSSASIQLAQQRSQHHGFEQIEFHVLALEDLPSLGMSFDYINCDEVLYMTFDPVAILQAMASVLKPNGIIRANLHSKLQRSPFYRAQEVFRRMNLMEGDTGELEVELVRQVMSSLAEGVEIKRVAWKYDAESEQSIRMNYLIQGDRGFTVPEVFELLPAANLEFVRMVNWQQWDLMSLFQNPEDLPPFLAMSLPLISQEELLHLFELLQPIHRLLDFWCVKQDATKSIVPVSEWSDDRWQRAWIHLHPQLKSTSVQENLMNCVRQYNSWQPSKYAFYAKEEYFDSSLAACLLPLWQGKQSFGAMVEHWLRLYPLDRVTFEPANSKCVAEDLKGFLAGLNEFPYLLIESEV